MSGNTNTIPHLVNKPIKLIKSEKMMVSNGPAPFWRQHKSVKIPDFPAICLKQTPVKNSGYFPGFGVF